LNGVVHAALSAARSENESIGDADGNRVSDGKRDLVFDVGVVRSDDDARDRESPITPRKNDRARNVCRARRGAFPGEPALLGDELE